MTPEFEFRLMKNSHLNKMLFDDIFREYQQHYKCYTIRQKNKLRQIEEPMPMLMLLQKSILLELKDLPLHPSCVARPGMSIRDNAVFHAGAKHLLKIDIQGCYQSIKYDYTHMVLRHKFDVSNNILEVLPICFIKIGDTWMLPTGAPTSPVVCNLALSMIDDEFSTLASKYGYQYTRYLDDLILSTKSPERHWRLLEEAKAILIDHDFLPHPKKCRWYSGGADRFIVTGVNVAGKISAPREIKRLVRARIDTHVKEGKPIDATTRGYLAHIQDIDRPYYLQMMAYLKRKRDRYVGTK